MSKKYCINCGNLVPESAKYCPHCGAPQYGQEAGKFLAQAPPIQLDEVVFQATATDTPQRQKLLHNQSDSKLMAMSATDRDQLFEKFQQKTSLGGNAVMSFFFSYVAKTAILIPLFAIAIVFEPIIAILGLTIYVFTLYAAAHIVCGSFKFWVDNHSFRKSSGIIHKLDVSIPYQQIQNVNINRSLTDRILGLSRVSIETAGNNSTAAAAVTGSSFNSSSEGYLPGLDLETAKQLHDLLLSRADESM